MPRTRGPRPWTLTVAAVLTWAFAIALAVIAVGTILQLHGRFSAGVGIMLLGYALVVGWVGWTAWSQRFYSRGALVGSALLHLAVAVSSMSAGNVVIWALVVIACVAIVICAVHPLTTRALRVAAKDPLDDA